MKKLISYLIVFSSCSYAWECPQQELNGESKIDYLWRNKDKVYVGSLVSGRVSENNKRVYEYEISVAQYLKSNDKNIVKITGDWSAQLEFGTQYIFFHNESKLGFCDFYAPFAFEWVEREDIPNQRKLVEKVISLSGIKKLP